MELISIVVSAFFLIVSSAIYLKSQLPKQTIANQNELINTYEKRIKALEDLKEEDRKQHIENVKAIAELQGQISVYKDIPLQSLADSMKIISKTNEEILTILKSQKIEETTLKTVVKKI